MSHTATPLFSYRKHWAECFGPAPFLPMSREEMDVLGWDSCDVIIVTGDAYVDHPSFGMAVIGRLLEAQGFRVGIISQPDWTNKEAFMTLGKPNLFWGIAAGNMDSMINRYTADKKLRHDDAYTAGNIGGKRPDRAVTVYAQKVRECYKGVPVVIGSIEASLRRIAHYDYWSDTVKRSVLVDSKADLLLYGNADRSIVEVAHRLNNGEQISELQDIRGTAFFRKELPKDWVEIDSTEVDRPGVIDKKYSPYQDTEELASCAKNSNSAVTEAMADEIQPIKIFDLNPPRTVATRDKSFIRIPSYEQVKGDEVLYAHASRVMHLETNPGNARALVQRHGKRDVWLTPPPIPLETDELDGVFALPYARNPHPSYNGARIPAFEMIRFSINIMRGCFGGCSFCSITEHEGRIIQNRSEDSIIAEVENIRDKTEGYTGTISDLGGPTANMWRLACKSKEIEESCRRLSCVHPGICKNLGTDQTPLISLYRRARNTPGVKRVLIASGLRYDLAVKTPEYVEELVTHHVGGYLKIAPEHTEEGPLSKMMKPAIGTYDAFKRMFEKFSKAAGKEQYLIPYFIAAHPGTSTEDMMNLALWLKSHGFKADQVQAFYPSPMANATTMYHSGRNPLSAISRKRGEKVTTAKGLRARRLHKAFLRYHDADNWPMIREALKEMGRNDLIGNGKKHLVPRDQPRTWLLEQAEKGRHIKTKHTGLPRNPSDKRHENSNDRRKNALREGEQTTNGSASHGKHQPAKPNRRREEKKAWSATAKGNISESPRPNRGKPASKGGPKKTADASHSHKSKNSRPKSSSKRTRR
ncbi:putative radical SAM protein YgiQ [Sinobacterium caligoides]|uniref:Putative radical SAM protein YgiQ n=1 Tax=Sinobacterium caligoides TaxID=933926 RepID=A0A3N2DYE6_9GAMM|nr:YgiQ family radical SAM protein [Sinobacterium caligoides]ROS04873.1 putative radical SAM protein YgiQ [Sinobacterium caligoides]